MGIMGAIGIPGCMGCIIPMGMPAIGIPGAPYIMGTPPYPPAAMGAAYMGCAADPGFGT